MARKQFTEFSVVRNNTCKNHRGEDTVDINIWVPWEGARKGDPIHVAQYVDEDGKERQRISARPFEGSKTRKIPYERNGKCFVKLMSQFSGVPPRSKTLGPAKVQWHGDKDFSVWVRDPGGHARAPEQHRAQERRDPRRNLMR